MSSTISAFTPGDLVVSISGDGAGTGSYTDNEAAPITLEELTTSGTIVGIMVLPQTTMVVNGVTEYAVSGEYGSSSEGTLELSADGQSLVIAGYGVNATAFNTGGAAEYGTAALAQSTSIQGGPDVAVARVVADVSDNGTIDTSTALYNIYDTNNPRSVATVNGTTFYLSGQGVKGGATQGVFLATDGASTATAIDTSTDTRTAELVPNGSGGTSLDVSRDSSQSTSSGTNIASYGTTPPTSGTTPTVLPGISESVTLTSAMANTVNGADIGSVVNLSPENFFFANADTLYVADGGNPKNGGLGDGGLQKWSFTGTTWVLDYTLSLGLDLVPDTATSGTSGLIGLTGVVSGGTVTLYATNETIGDLDPTYLYTITDTLSATSPAPGQAFTVVTSAAPDTNIRGIAFAPTASATTPTATTVSNGQVVSGLTVTSGSTLSVAATGLVEATTILSGGSATVSGRDSGGIIAHGGFETVLGSAVGDDVAGIQLVSAANADVGSDVIENGGLVELFLKGAIASSTTVTTGGTLAISGAAFGFNTVIAGGTVELESAKAELNGSLTFSGPGTVEVTAAISSGYGDQALISGFGAGDVIDLTTVSAGGLFSVAVVSGNTVATFGSGSAAELFTFSGSAISALLSAGPDAGSGTELAYVPPAPKNTVVSAGSSLSGFTVTSGSTLVVQSGATLVSATVDASGVATISGSDAGTTILAGGNETVLGTATADTIAGVQLVSAGTAVVTGETVVSGGALDLYLKGAIASSTTVSSGGTLNISGNATASGTVLEAGAVLDLQSPKATLAGGVTFAGPATLEVTSATSAGFGDLTAISGFSAGSVVDDTVLAYAGASLGSAVVSGNTVETITNGGASESFIFAGTGASFALQADAGSGSQIVAGGGGPVTVGGGAPCFCPGTLILTERGQVAVEHLAIGDGVLTAVGTVEPIRWIGRRCYGRRFLVGRPALWPVRIGAGALGGGLPRRDLVVSPLHAMLLDGVLVPARELVNGRSIVQELGAGAVEYIHVELARHSIIQAEGAPTETFLDDDSRTMFHNAAEYAALYGGGPVEPGLACAPRVESGYALEAIRRRLGTVAADFPAAA